MCLQVDILRREFSDPRTVLAGLLTSIEGEEEDRRFVHGEGGRLGGWEGYGVGCGG